MLLIFLQTEKYRHEEKKLKNFLHINAKTETHFFLTSPKPYEINR